MQYTSRAAQLYRQQLEKDAAKLTAVPKPEALGDSAPAAAPEQPAANGSVAAAAAPPPADNNGSLAAADAPAAAAPGGAFTTWFLVQGCCGKCQCLSGSPANYLTLFLVQAYQYDSTSLPACAWSSRLFIRPADRPDGSMANS